MTRGHANVPVCRAAGVVLLGTSRRVINLRETVKAYEKGRYVA